MPRAPVRVVKTTVRLPEALWEKAKIRAVEERQDFQSLVIAALDAYLARPSPTKKRRA